MQGKTTYLDKVKVFTKVILVRDDGRILTLRRSKTSVRRVGCWDFPGGNLEKGEDILESARREVDEETGISVGELKPVFVGSRTGYVEEGLDVVAICFSSMVSDEKVRLSREHDEFEWMSPEEFLVLETGDDGGFLKAAMSAYMDQYEA